MVGWKALPLAACAALSLLCPMAHAQEFDLAKALAEAVDKPDAAQRRSAALRLANREDVTMDALLAAMTAFGTFEKHHVGIVEEAVEVHVETGTEHKDVYVYVPEGYDPAEPAPMLLALHGSGGDGRREYLGWEATADALGMLVVAYTEGRAESGYTFEREERLAALGVMRWARRNFNVDETRIFCTGISRGGHLTWDLALRYPDRFAAIAPMIGGPRWSIAGGRNNLRYIENVAWMPIRDLQGWKDDPRMLFNLEVAFEKLDAYKAADAKLLRFPELGHSFELDSVDWKEFLGGARRDPVPKSVVRTVARLDEARAHWFEVLKIPAGVQETFTPKLDPRKWNALDDNGKRRKMIAAADKRTGRASARYLDRGRFSVEVRDVQKIRILLTEEMFVPGSAVQVKWRGKMVKKAAVKKKRVLLLEFVERFDRTFLPVAEVRLP